MENKVEEWLEKRGQDIKEEWKELTEDYLSRCESPIEKLFFIEWKYQNEAHCYHEYFYVMPQYKIDNYRVDFLVYFNTDNEWMDKQDGYPEYHKDKALIIELDSHLWHGLKPEQFTKEKERERELQKKDWHIMRFSGREIYRNVEKCVDEVVEYFGKIKKYIPIDKR